MTVLRNSNAIHSGHSDAHSDNSDRSGFSLVEGILAAGLLGMLVTSLVGLFIYGQESTRIAGTRILATFLAEEGMEAVRNIVEDADAADGGYTNLPADSPVTHGIKVSSAGDCDTAGDAYKLCGTSDTTNFGTVYTRTITISSETLPPRKKVISKVTWTISPAREGSISIEGHFTNWR